MNQNSNLFVRVFAFLTIFALLFSSLGVLAQGDDGEICDPKSIEINTASFEELQLIIHIGEVRAEQMIELRGEQPFSDLDNLDRVDGITAGGKRLADIIEQGCAWVDVDLLEDDGEGEPFLVEGDVEVPSGCEVVDTDGVAHIFPKDDSPSEFLGICALVAAKAADIISAFEVSDHPDFGLFVHSVHEVAADSSSEFWALWHKESGKDEFGFADCGIGCLALSEGDELSLIRTSFDGEERDTATLVVSLVLEEEEEEQDDGEGEEESSSGGRGGDGGSGGNGPAPLDVGAAVEKATVFLQGKSVSPDIVMALAVAGKSVDISFLRSFSSDTVIDYAKPMLALTAAGEDPRTYPDEDWGAKMKSFAGENQLGDPDFLNDDIWGILALRSAGVPVSDRVIQNSKTFLLQNQNDDGGWAWNVGGDSDTNDTAGAIMALLEVGMIKSDTAIQKAILYLKSAQNDDGGFPYDPQSPWGTDSDGNSTAWGIMAINKLGEDPKSSTWTKNPNPVDFLLSLQDENGEFWWMPGSKGFGATTDAVIALIGKSFPVNSISAPQEEQDAAQGGGGTSASAQTLSQEEIGKDEETASEEALVQMARQLEEIAVNVEEMRQQIEVLVATRMSYNIVQTAVESGEELVSSEGLPVAYEEPVGADSEEIQEKEKIISAVLAEELAGAPFRAEVKSAGFMEIVGRNGWVAVGVLAASVMFGFGAYRFGLIPRTKRRLSRK